MAAISNMISDNAGVNSNQSMPSIYEVPLYLGRSPLSLLSGVLRILSPHEKNLFFLEDVLIGSQLSVTKASSRNEFIVRTQEITINNFMHLHLHRLCRSDKCGT